MHFKTVLVLSSYMLDCNCAESSKVGSFISRMRASMRSTIVISFNHIGIEIMKHFQHDVFGKIIFRL